MDRWTKILKNTHRDGLNGWIDKRTETDKTTDEQNNDWMDKCIEGWTKIQTFISKHEWTAACVDNRAES